MPHMKNINEVNYKIADNFFQKLLSNGEITTCEYKNAQKHIVKKYQPFLSYL